MQIAFYFLLFIVGACFGSFLCCQARRLHHRAGKRRSKLSRRSVCLHCKKPLKWYDNLPIISWLALKGKCRYCHQKIGLAELLSELGLAVAFLLIGTNFDIAAAFPMEWVVFIIVLIFTSILAFLAIYDGLYGELPTIFLIIAIALACVILALRTYVILSSSAFSAELIWRPLTSVLILGGLYLVLYLISKGKWVGDGDWLLGTAIAIVLADPWLSLFALFIANFSACLVMLPSVKGNKTHKIHFGPFLVIAFVIVFSFAKYLQSML